MVTQQLSSPTGFATSAAGASLKEGSAFMTEQLRTQIAEQRVHDEAQRQKVEAQLEAQRQDYDSKLRERDAKLRDCEAKLHDCEAKLRDCETKLRDCEANRDCEAKLRDCEAKAQAKTCATDDQLERLQARFDALHQAKLLTNDEIFALEDRLTDFIECRSSVTVSPGEMGAAAESVRKLVGICEAVSKDGMLARQLRRKFL